MPILHSRFKGSVFKALPVRTEIAPGAFHEKITVMILFIGIFSEKIKKIIWVWGYYLEGGKTGLNLGC